MFAANTEELHSVSRFGHIALLVITALSSACGVDTPTEGRSAGIQAASTHTTAVPPNATECDKLTLDKGFPKEWVEKKAQYHFFGSDFVPLSEFICTIQQNGWEIDYSTAGVFSKPSITFTFNDGEKLEVIITEAQQSGTIFIQTIAMKRGDVRIDEPAAAAAQAYAVLIQHMKQSKSDEENQLLEENPAIPLSQEEAQQLISDHLNHNNGPHDEPYKIAFVEQDLNRDKVVDYIAIYGRPDRFSIYGQPDTIEPPRIYFVSCFTQRITSPGEKMSLSFNTIFSGADSVSDLRDGWISSAEQDGSTLRVRMENGMKVEHTPSCLKIINDEIGWSRRVPS